MIPKVIHYIWLGNGNKSKLSEICIHTWKEKLPDFEIIEWNEEKIDIDVIAQSNAFFAECRKRKLWAFMADYLRLKILYEQGGIYFDTDIEAVKDLTQLLNRPLLIGYEKDYRGDLQIGTGVIGCVKGNAIIKECLDFYESEIWNVNFYTIPRVMEYVLRSHKNVDILPYTALTPFAYNEPMKRDNITEDTYTIHWFEGTWSEKLEIRTFMKTKHIKNPVKRNIMKVLQVCKYYKERWIG